MLLTPDLALELNLAAAIAMATVLWVVQLAVYPLFDGIGADSFATYHRRYTTAIGWIVGPVMLLEVIATTAQWILGARSGAFYVATALLSVNWLATALVQVPLHRRLSRGFEASAHRRLVWSNWVRTFCWSARAAILFALPG